MRTHLSKYCRTFFKLFLCALFFFYLLNLSQSWAGHPEGSNLSSGELLKYSLKDLKKRIRNINQENQKLSERNQSVRKRILVYKQEIRKLGDLKIQLQERENELKSDHQVDGQQVSIWQMKQENAQLLLVQLKKRKEHLENFVQEQQERRSRNEKKAQDLYKRLEEFRGRIPQQKDPEPDPEYLKHNEEMKAELEESRLLIMDMSQKVPALKKRVAFIENSYNSLSRENDGLTDQLAGLRAVLKKTISERQKLREESQRLKNRINVNISQQKTDIGHWRLYRNNLKDALERQRSLAQAIQKDYSEQHKPLRQWLNILSRQNELLVEKKEVLDRVLHAVGLLDTEMRQSITAKQKKEGSEQVLDKLSDKKADHQEKIALAQHESPGLSQKARRLKKEIRRLQVRLERVTNKTQVLQKRAGKKTRKELLGLSDKEERDIKNLQQKISAATKKVDDYNSKVLIARNFKESNTKDLKLLGEQLAKLAREQKDIEEDRKLIDQSPDEALVRIKRDIEKLKSQRDIIESSLEAIKILYQQQETAIKEFSDEESQLNEYFQILKTENSGLKEKLKVLKSSLEPNSP